MKIPDARESTDDEVRVADLMFLGIDRLKQAPKTVVLAIAIPLALIFLIEVLVHVFVQDENAIAPLLITTGLTTLLGAMVAVPIHRLLLIDDDTSSKFLSGAGIRRVVVFACVCFGLFTLVPAGLTVLLKELPRSVQPFMIFGGFLLYLYAFARLLLVFPAIATDQPWGLRRMWNVTSEHQRLTIAVGWLMPIFFVVIVAAFSWILPDVMMNLCIWIASAGFTVLWVATISETYRHIAYRKV